MKLKNLAAAAIGLGALAFAPLAQAQFADIVLVVDESGSMAGEHAWIDGMISALNTKLVAAGVGSGVDKNMFSVVGFGSDAGHGAVPGHLHTNLTSDLSVGGAFDVATNTLTTGGGFEDGYTGIDFAANNVSFRSGSKRNFILITDEDRDVTAGSTLTAATISATLKRLGALLNVVVDQAITGGKIGSNGGAKTYAADGVGGFTVGPFTSWGAAFGTTKTDYVDVAIGSGGASWDLNILRNGGLGAASFTEAFIDLKVGEIIEQPPGSGVPEPKTYGMIGAAVLLALITVRRRMQKA